MERPQLFEEFESDDVIYSGNAISPSDFFALTVISPRIRDGHLIDLCLQFGKFYRDLRLETESLGLQRDTIKNILFDDLIACFHIR